VRFECISRKGRKEKIPKAAKTTKLDALCETLFFGDFYGLNKRMLINFLIHALIFYTGKNPTYQLIAHSIHNTHFILS